MQSVNVQTAQNVVIEYPVAGVGDRILATIVDGFIIVSYAFVLIVAISQLEGDAAITAMLLLYLPMMFYHLACEVFMDGQSFGKKVMNIRVVRLDGTSPSLGSYLVRWITRFFETGLFMGMPAIIAVVVSDKGQRLGDIAAGTCVVKLRDMKIGETLFQALDDDYELTHVEVQKLTDQDVDIIKEVLRVYNRTGRTPQAKSMVERTVEVVSDKMGVSTQLPGVAFLRVVVKDYNHFAGNLSLDPFE